MADVIKTGSDWLMAKLKANCSTTVSLRRHVSETTGVSATVGSSDHQQIDELGGVIQMESRDYLIDSDDYTFSGVETEPKRGDVIVETIDGVVNEFEVMPFLGGAPWRWSDDYHTKYRIHTQKVKVG